MSKKNKILLGALVACSVSTAAVAEVKVTVGGSLDTQYGAVSQKKLFRSGKQFDAAAADKDSGTRSRTSLLSNTGAISVKADGAMEESELKYGGLMVFNANTSDAKGFSADHHTDLGKDVDKNVLKQSMMYVESPFGKVEIGATPSVGSAMQVSANQLNAAPNDAIYYVNPYSYAKASSPALVRDTFLQTANLYTNEEGIVGTRSLNANKINLYSPRYMGVMLGLSYTPDLAVNGTSSSATAATKYADKSYISYKDVFQGGLHFEQEFNDLGVKASVLAETAKSKVKSEATKKQRKLSGYEAGLQVSYMGASLAGSIGSHGKSSSFKTDSVKATKYWTIGAAYAYGPATASLTYMDSRRGIVDQAKANKIEQITFAVNYKVAEGFAPYASVTNFRFKDNAKSAVSNKANVFLVGSKLNF